MRLARRMLANDKIFINGFLCDEEDYGGGSASYLTNAQGLVGVLLPFLTSDFETPSPVEAERILLAADDVLKTVLSEDSNALLDLQPYISIGSIRKLLPPQAKQAINRATFRSTHGVSWALSALLLLYTADVLAKLEMGQEREERVRKGIVDLYGLLLDLFRRDGERAGWGWCSLSTAPDLYHTWSAVQTIGDLEDYTFNPSDSRLRSAARRSALEANLREVASSKLRQKHIEGTLGLYKEVARWIYQELTGPDRATIHEATRGASDPKKAEIYYEFLCLETLVYVKADEFLPDILGIVPEKFRAQLSTRLSEAVRTLGELRDTPWYESAAESTLRIPLMLPSPAKDSTLFLLEPCLEPLALRAMSYGPQYLGDNQFVEFVSEALRRHAGLLDPRAELWDTKAINVLICERTIEAFGMLRAMFDKMQEEQKQIGGVQLLLPPDQVNVLATALLERVRQLLAQVPPQAGAPPAPAPSDAGLDLLELLEPTQYDSLLEPKEVTTLLDSGPVGRSSEDQHRAMLVQTLVRTLLAVLEVARPSDNRHRVTAQLSDALARAVAAVLPQAFAYYLEALLGGLADKSDLAANFNRPAAESQIRDLAVKYLQWDFREQARMDLAAYLEDAFSRTHRRGGT